MTERIIKGGPRSGHRRHRGRRGHVGGSLPGTKNFLLKSGLFDDKYVEWSPGQERALAVAADEARTLPEHYEGLNAILLGSESGFGGSYDPGSQEIALGGGLLEGVGVDWDEELGIAVPVILTAGNVLSHELGHHLTCHRLPDQVPGLTGPKAHSKALSYMANELEGLLEEMFWKREPVDIARDYGVPPHDPYRGGEELMAEMYLTHLWGDDRQWENLRELFDGYGIDIDKLYAP